MKRFQRLWAILLATMMLMQMMPVSALAEQLGGKLQINVKLTGGEYVYDGQPHGFTIEIVNENAHRQYMEGGCVEFSDAGMLTHVGSISADDAATNLRAFTAAGVEVTEYVTFNVIAEKRETLSVIPKTLTVTTESNTQPYTGEKITAAGSYSGLVEGETITFEIISDRTAVGTEPNNYRITWNGTAQENDYTIEEHLGTLKVTAAPVTVTTCDASKTEGDTDPEFSADVDGLFGEDKVSYAFSREEGETKG